MQRLRGRARARAHGGAWLPAALVAALLLASIALYQHPFDGIGGPIERPPWAGLPNTQRDPLLSYLFWFLGVPVLFGATGLWYRWRERRYGMRVNWRLFAGTGTAALLVLTVLAAIPSRQSGWTGPAPSADVALLLSPLLAVAVSVIALGVVERSRGLVAAGVWLSLITAWQCAYGYGWGMIPGWVTWMLGGFENYSDGGQLTLFGLDTAGGTILVMTTPLVLFALVGAIRSGRRR